MSEFLECDNSGMLSLVSVPHGAVTRGIYAGIMTGKIVAWPWAAPVANSNPRNSEFLPPSVFVVVCCCRGVGVLLLLLLLLLVLLLCWPRRWRPWPPRCLRRMPTQDAFAGCPHSFSSHAQSEQSTPPLQNRRTVKQDALRTARAGGTLRSLVGVERPSGASCGPLRSDAT